MYSLFIETLVKYSQSIQYSNGDIVLYLNGSHELTNKGGILQVYLYRWHDEDFPEGIWTNICSETFNRPAAAATCRQLGYIDAIDYGPYQKFQYSPKYIILILVVFLQLSDKSRYFFICTNWSIVLNCI